MGIKEQMNGFFDKLPFKVLAEKIPLLAKAAPFANQIVCGLVAVAVVSVAVATGGGKSPENIAARIEKLEAELEKLSGELEEAEAKREAKAAKVGGGGLDGEYVTEFNVDPKQEIMGVVYADGTMSQKYTFSGDKWTFYMEIEGGSLKEMNSGTFTLEGDTLTMLVPDMYDPDYTEEQMWTLSKDKRSITDGENTYTKQGGKTAAKAEKKPAKAKGGGKASPSSDFEFTFDDKTSTVTITGYSGKGGKVVIPAEIEGYPVVAISGNAFAAQWMERTYVHDRQKFLDASAEHERRGGSSTSYPLMSDPRFNHWEEAHKENPAAARITDITIPESITSIGGQGFKGNKNLETVTLQGSAEIASGAFSGCGKISIKTRQALKEAGYTDGF